MLTKRFYMAMFLFLFSAYFLTARGYLQVCDTDFSFRTAKALITKGTLVIEGAGDEIGLPGMGKPIVTDKEHCASTSGYSKYGIGLPILFIPATALAVFLSGISAISVNQIGGFLISFYNCFFGACAGILLFRTLLLFSVPLRAAFFSVLALCFGTVFWIYSIWDFSDVTQSFFLLLAVYYFVRRGKNDLLKGCLAYSFLLLLKIVYCFYIPIFAVYLALPKPVSVKRPASFLFFSLLTLCFLILLNYLRWGAPLYFGYPSGDFIFSPRIILIFIKQTISIDYGLFIYSPILILGAIGYFFFIRKYPLESFLFLGVIVTNIFFNSGLWYWSGASAYGSRYVVPIIPLIILPLFMLLKSDLLKKIFIALFALSCFLQIGGVLTKSQEYDHIRSKAMPVEIRNQMPSDMVGAFVILKHRLAKGDNIYAMREFGVQSDAIFDTSFAESFRGLNLWWCHLARTYHKPIFYIVPFIILPLMLFCLISCYNYCAKNGGRT